MITLDTYGERGFSASWGWTPDWQQHVAAIKKTAGFKFNKARKAWLSDGPEVLLDLDRYRIPHVMTAAATARAAEFNAMLNAVVNLKAQPLPEGLYAFQDADAEIAALAERAILGHPRGMGKSKMALTAAKKLGCKMILVLVMFEGTLVYNWPDEVEKWCPEWTWAIVPETGPKARAKFWEETSVNVWIANSGKVLLSDWPLEAQWDCVIVDEIGRAKNRQTVTHKKLRQVAHNARYFFGLGSVMEMRPEDTNAVMDLARPSVLGDMWRFTEQHLLKDSWGKTLGLSPNGRQLLKERLGPWLIQRDKDLLGLPRVLSNVHYIELSEKERRIYTDLEKHFAKWVRDNKRNDKEINPLTQLMRFQQCVDSTQLLDERNERGSKWAALLEEIQEHDGKVVVFTKFATMASLLAIWLETEYYIIGEAEFGLPQIKKQDRVAKVKEFNDTTTEKVLVSTDAGAYGLNITGADLIIHFDQLWNPEKMEQRRDRLHRIGQKKRVNEVHLICHETIDEGMMKVVEQRRELVTDVKKGAEESVLAKFNTPTLRRLIQGRI